MGLRFRPVKKGILNVDFELVLDLLINQVYTCNAAKLEIKENFIFNKIKEMLNLKKLF